ncbi:hypothetical protein [Streptomyces sp. XH2]|uniref:hypothetical protein n=1 Tax=Streptomyces sp. XH2 TaxID=3412483 RepID=UPI003C7BFE70
MSIAATNAARDWLSESDPDPDHADLWLTSAHVLVLPLGFKWCVVKVPADLGTAAVDGGLRGPAILEPGRYVYFAVPNSTIESWDVPDTECLGEGVWLGVPGPKVVAPPGLHWLTLPDGTLVDPDALRAALKPCQ